MAPIGVLGARLGTKMVLNALKDIPPWDWPPGTGAMLQDILLDDLAAESDLRVAAELAGEFTVIDDDLTHALLSNLGSGKRSEEVRSRAAISLGPVLEYADTAGFEDTDDAPVTERAVRRIQESLHALYVEPDVPKEVRRRVLEASVRAREDWHQDAVRGAYSSGDEAFRLTAVFCMRYVPGFDEQILEALASGDLGGRRACSLNVDCQPGEPMGAKKRRPSPKMQAWIDARRRHHLSHAQVQMARELGMNPAKLGKLDNHDQEPWKMPLRQFIEHLYLKRFNRGLPDTVMSIEDRLRLEVQKKEAKRVAKQQRTAETP